MGIGGIIAFIGGVGFILIAVKSVFFGEPLPEITRGVEMVGVPRGLTHPPVHAPDADERNAALHDPKRGIAGATPGTLVLVAVFLLAFVVYYFANWKLLSFLWKIG
jgi:cytochrome c oxidase subunit 1